MQDSLPAGELRLCRAGVEPAGSLRTVSCLLSPPFVSLPPFRGLLDASWSHARRKFFELADISGNVSKGKPAHQISPVALEAVKRIAAIFDIEREINGLDPEARAVRRELSRPLVDRLHDWLLEERAKLSRHNKIAARVVEIKTRICLHLPTSCPDHAILRIVLSRIPRLAT